ncbi:MAG: BatA domain-containing protein [Planctomycetota bacterium]|nr:BatA domain-containing protein [Planctomycetota bacterium]
MTFLTPWFIAGLAAVSLPILFHMIRRTPRGRMPFSTLMFLEPSPPRITSRSKLNHWLLLLLRATALCLLVLAFGRPYWRQMLETSDAADTGRRIALVIDTSASMQRADLWERAIIDAKRRVDELGPHDRLAVYAFDRRLRRVFGFDDWKRVAAVARTEILHECLDELKPSWAKTDLGQALVEVSENLDGLTVEESQTADTAPREIVVISDMQAGSTLAALRGYVWPERVKVRLARIEPSDTTNAGIQLVGFHKQNAFQQDAHVRTRIANAADSTSESFRLAWLDADGRAIPDAEFEVYVAPGESRIVRAPTVPEGRTSTRLRLSGDAHEFDNTAHIPSAVQRQLNVAYLGGEWRDEIDSIEFLAEFVFPEHRYRRIHVLPHTPDAPAISAGTGDVSLALVTRGLDASEGAMLNQFVRAGGTVVFAPSTAEHFSTIAPVLGNKLVTVTEAVVTGYAMLASINFEHPLLAPFAEAKFTDFTAIHVWNHREFNVDQIGDCEVLARFDDGQPAIVEKRVGDGRVILMTTSWHTEDSQLAQSSKLSPLLNVILEHDAGAQPTESYAIGDVVPLGQWNSGKGKTEIRLPSEKSITLDSGAHEFTQTSTPGLYSMDTDARASSIRFVVNLDADESNTSPLPREELEALGVSVSPDNGTATALNSAELTEHERQMQGRELEEQQKFWRWLILAALVFLMAETWLSKRIAVASDLAS